MLVIVAWPDSTTAELKLGSECPNTTQISAIPASPTEALTPPFPLTKVMPKLNSELIRIYLRNVIVVYAVMDTQGDLKRLSVRQGPTSAAEPFHTGSIGTLEIPTG